MYMTISEVDRKYEGQWVYLVNLKKGEHGEVIGGEVAAHNENREKVMREMLYCPDGGIYVIYAGKIPEGVSVLL